MTVPSNAKAEANATPRLKSAVLWGVVGAMFFLVFHQWYLLLDGEFLGVGPVAAVAVGVFVATVVASYFTVGHLEVFEPGGAAIEDPEAGEAEPATETEPATGRDATGTDTEGSADVETGDDGSDGDAVADESVDVEPEKEVVDDEAMDEWIWGGQDADG